MSNALLQEFIASFTPARLECIPETKVPPAVTRDVLHPLKGLDDTKPRLYCIDTLFTSHLKNYI